MNLYLDNLSSADDAQYAVIPTDSSERITFCDMRSGSMIDTKSGEIVENVKGILVPNKMGGRGNDNTEEYNVFDTEAFPRFGNNPKDLEALLNRALDQSETTGRELDTKAFYLNGWKDHAKNVKQDDGSFKLVYPKGVTAKLVRSLMKKWDLSTLEVTKYKYGASLRVWLPGKKGSKVSKGKVSNDLKSEGWIMGTKS
tara:strand:- start:14 stop:607 length:594 start_codon:yes stop_codon:yes gene_type:complete